MDDSIIFLVSDKQVIIVLNLSVYATLQLIFRRAIAMWRQHGSHCSVVDRNVALIGKNQFYLKK